MWEVDKGSSGMGRVNRVGAWVCLIVAAFGFLVSLRLLVFE